MYVAVISDIHANLTALKAVLLDINKRYGKNIFIINLGDCIDYGMRPNETIEILANLKNIIVNIQGNHERALCGFELDRFSSERGYNANCYTKSILNSNSKDFLNKMGKKYVELELYKQKILCIHGDLNDIYWGKMNDDEIKKQEYEKYNYIFSGHTHIPSLRNVINKNKLHRTIFINPGSVGQPRNLNPCAQYCIINLKNSEVFFNSVRYDINLEQSFYKGEIDEYYKNRLVNGI